MYAYWGKPELRGPHFNGFSVEISAVSGELLEINFGKALTLPLIKDVDKLLAISDEEFLKYSDEEKSNLVVRFSAVAYPVSTNASLHLLSQTNAPTGN